MNNNGTIIFNNLLVFFSRQSSESDQASLYMEDGIELPCVRFYFIFFHSCCHCPGYEMAL